MNKIKLEGIDIPLFISKESYANNNTTALTIYCVEDGYIEPYIEVTTNIEEAKKHLNDVGDNAILVKTWSENESLIEPLLKSGFFEDTGDTVYVSDWCYASIWKVIKEISGDSEIGILEEE